MVVGTTALMVTPRMRKVSTVIPDASKSRPVVETHVEGAEGRTTRCWRSAAAITVKTQAHHAFQLFAGSTGGEGRVHRASQSRLLDGRPTPHRHGVKVSRSSAIGLWPRHGACGSYICETRALPARLAANQTPAVPVLPEQMVFRRRLLTSSLVQTRDWPSAVF